MAQFGQLTTCPCLLLLPLWKFVSPEGGAANFPMSSLADPEVLHHSTVVTFFGLLFRGKRQGPFTP